MIRISITGPAGSGKSTMGGDIMQMLIGQGKNVWVDNNADEPDPMPKEIDVYIAIKDEA